MIAQILDEEILCKYLLKTRAYRTTSFAILGILSPVNWANNEWNIKFEKKKIVTINFSDKTEKWSKMDKWRYLLLYL